MALRKCPKCELNYLLNGEQFCSVCSGKMKTISYIEEDEGELDLCPHCGERPVARGEEYCAECLAELNKTDAVSDTEAELSEEESPKVIKSIDEVSNLDVMDVPSFELPEIDDEDELDNDFDDDDLDEDEDLI